MTQTDVKHGTSIEWTHGSGFKGETWNPVTGCDRVSPGCANCYALTLAPRLRRFALAQAARHPDRPRGKWADVGDGGKKSGPAFGVTLHPSVLEQPLHWRSPRMVFVNSMSDLFHEEVPDAFIYEVLKVVESCPKHTFQVLTKRPARMREVMRGFYWMRAFDHNGPPLPNLWLGVSIENRSYLDRADLLRETPAAVRFISAEPLLGPLLPLAHVVGERDAVGLPEFVWEDDKGGDCPGLDLTGIDWLIVGGENGPGHRPMKVNWVRDLRDAVIAKREAWIEQQRLAGGKWGCGSDGALLTMTDPADLPWCAENGYMDWRPSYLVVLPDGSQPTDDTTRFFFKQDSGPRPGSRGRFVDEREWPQEMPMPSGVSG